MRAFGRLFAGFQLSIVLVCASVQWAQTPSKTIETPHSGKIVYGTVDGAATLADALVAELGKVQGSFGEKPKIGQAFKVRSTDSMAVFFTVTDHNHENKQISGLIIAATTAQKQIEAALVSDSAERFARTENSMLQQLCSAWSPAGLASSSSSMPRRFAAWESCLATGVRWAPPAKLHEVKTADKSTSISLPDGWKMDPKSANGTLLVTGPNGELAALDLIRPAVESAALELGMPQKDGAKSENSDKIVYPANASLAKAFPDLLQQWRKLNGLGPAELHIDHAEPMPAAMACAVFMSPDK